MSAVVYYFIEMYLGNFAAGDTLGATQPAYFLRQTVSGQSLATHNALTVQSIEGVRTYAGQTVTILGWARRSSGAGNMAVELMQIFGTGGSTAVTAGSAIVTLGGTWTPFAVVVNVPSLAGKTIGTVTTDCLQLAIWTSAGADFAARASSLGLQAIAVDLWGVHIRTGTWTAADAALYRPRDPGTELALCQRYYYIINQAATWSWYGDGATRGTPIWRGHPVTMRATPTTTTAFSAGTNVGAGSVIPTSTGVFAFIGNATAGAASVTLTLGAFDAEL